MGSTPPVGLLGDKLNIEKGMPKLYSIEYQLFSVGFVMSNLFKDERWCSKSDTSSKKIH